MSATISVADSRLSAFAFPRSSRQAMHTVALPRSSFAAAAKEEFKPLLKLAEKRLAKFTPLCREGAAAMYLMMEAGIVHAMQGAHAPGARCRWRGAASGVVKRCTANARCSRVSAAAAPDNLHRRMPCVAPGQGGGNAFYSVMQGVSATKRALAVEAATPHLRQSLPRQAKRARQVSGRARGAAYRVPPARPQSYGGHHEREGAAHSLQLPPPVWEAARRHGAYLQDPLFHGAGATQMKNSLCNEAATAWAVHIRQHFSHIVLESLGWAHDTAAAAAAAAPPTPGHPRRRAPPIHPHCSAGVHGAVVLRIASCACTGILCRRA